MKKIVFLLIFLYTSMPLAYGDNVTTDSTFIEKTQNQFSTWVNSTWEFLENAQLETFMPFLKTIPAGTVAIVNGTEISFRQVEALGDMELAGRGDNRPVNLDSISHDYARHLAELIEQTLIHQELTKKGMLVGMDKVTEIEEIIRKSYDAETFEEILAEDSINPQFWREQMLSRLEKEAWQNFLAKQAVITEEEIQTYLTTHSDSLEKPEKYTLVLVSSPNEEFIKEAYTKKVQSVSPENKVFVQERTLAVAALPDLWQEELKKLSPGDFSPIKKQENTYAYLVYKKKELGQVLTNLETYALVERALTDTKTSELYLEWLNTALQNANISISTQLMEVMTNNKVQ